MAAPAKDQYTAEDDPKNLIEIDERNREVVTLFNRGGVHLNEAIDLVKRLAASSAVFVESFRPGTLEAMGLAPQPAGETFGGF